MAAAALAIPGAVDLAKETGSKVKAFLTDDPIIKIGSLLLKFGTAIAAIGIIATLSAPGFNSAATNERNDIEDTVGLPRTQPPGTPAPPPPPPPYYVADFQTIADTFTKINTPLASQAGAACIVAANAAFDLATNANATGAPAGIAQNANLLGASFALLSVEFGYPAPAVTNPLPIPYPTSTFDPSTVKWGGVPSLTWSVSLLTNGLASKLNIPPPLKIADSESASPPPNPNDGILSWLNGAVTVGYDVFSLALAPGLLIAQGAQDLYPAAQTLYNDAAGVAGDIAKGLQVIGSALINMPRILGDSLGFVFNWTLGQICGALGPILMWIGIGMAVAGGLILFVYRDIWPKLESRVVLASNARLARFWNAVDVATHSRKKVKEVRGQVPTQVQIDAANALVQTEIVPPVETATPPSLDAGRPAEAQQTEPQGVGGEVPAPPISEPPAEPPAGPEQVNPPPEVSEPTPGQTNALATPPGEPPVAPEPEKPPEPAPGVMTEAEATAYLGDRPNRAPTPEELRQMADEAERERRKTRKPEWSDEPTREQLMEMAA